MRIIGITGGIGTGKSRVLNYLHTEFGAYIMETDKLAHRLMEPGNAVYHEIVRQFGSEILSEDASIDRARLGAIVFRDEVQLDQLNHIVHPAVKSYILKDIEEQRAQNITYYVIEAALLIEDGYREICDELWFIHTEQQIRIERLLHNRGGDHDKWKQVIENQSSDAFYAENCDVIIRNDADFSETENTIKQLLYNVT